MRAVLLGITLWSAPAVPEWSDLGHRAVEFMRSRPGGYWRTRYPEERAWYKTLGAMAWHVTRVYPTGGSPDASFTVAGGSSGESLFIPPELVLAIAFRESSWYPDVIGKANEIGLMQLKGNRALLGYSASSTIRAPALNLWLGVRHLRRSWGTCGSLRRGLIQYASGSCRPRGRSKRRAEYAADLVLRWAERMKRPAHR